MKQIINKDILRATDMFLKKNSGKILTGLSCMGVIGTTIVAIRQDRKAQQAINSIETDRLVNHGDIRSIAKTDWEMDRREKYKIYFKYHLPTALVGLGTITCIVGTGYVSQQAQASLLSAYGLLNESYTDYRRKNIELYGVDNHKKILESIAVEQSKGVDLHSIGAFHCSDLRASALSNDYPRELFYDEFSRRFFESTLPAVIEAQYHVNRNLVLGAPVIVNDWYTFLGLANTTEGNELGWFMNDEYCWIDFTNEERYLQDGTKYISINVDFEPDTRWQEEW